MPLGGGVPVSVLASAPIVSVGPGLGMEGREGPEEAGAHEAVVLDEAASDEAFLAGGAGDRCGAGIQLVFVLGGEGLWERDADHWSCQAQG